MCEAKVTEPFMLHYEDSEQVGVAEVAFSNGSCPVTKRRPDGRVWSVVTLYFWRKSWTRSEPTALEMRSWSSPMMFSMREIQLISSWMAWRDASFSICSCARGSLRLA